MSTENRAETELRTAADFIQEAARYVNWKPSEKHSEQARYDALRALSSIHAYMAAVSLETLRRIDPAAAERVAEHLGRDDWDLYAENAWTWNDHLAKGEPIDPDGDVFPKLAGQTDPCACPIFTTHTTHGNPWCQCGHQYSSHTSPGAACTMPAGGEHHTGTSPISDELVSTAAEHMHGVEQTYFGPSTYAPHIAQMLSRAALEAAYPAIRQQVLDQVMARLIAEGGTERAKAIVREIGGAE